MGSTEEVEYAVNADGDVISAGRVPWNGAMYTHLLDEHGDKVTVVDSGDLYEPSEWRDIDPPEPIVEDIADPRKNSVFCFDPDIVPRANYGSKKPIAAVNQSFEEMIPGKGIVQTVSMDCFWEDQSGVINWEHS